MGVNYSIYPLSQEDQLGMRFFNAFLDQAPFEIEMRKGAKILSAKWCNFQIEIYVEESSNGPKVKRLIQAVRPGSRKEVQGNFIDTVQCGTPPYYIAVHVFDLGEK